jgi:hypothetical protein
MRAVFALMYLALFASAALAQPARICEGRAELRCLASAAMDRLSGMTTMQRRQHLAQTIDELAQPLATLRDTDALAVLVRMAEEVIELGGGLQERFAMHFAASKAMLIAKASGAPERWQAALRFAESYDALSHVNLEEKIYVWIRVAEHAEEVGLPGDAAKARERGEARAKEHATAMEDTETAYEWALKALLMARAKLPAAAAIFARGAELRLPRTEAKDVSDFAYALLRSGVAEELIGNPAKRRARFERLRGLIAGSAQATGRQGAVAADAMWLLREMAELEVEARDREGLAETLALMSRLMAAGDSPAQGHTRIVRRIHWALALARAGDKKAASRAIDPVTWELPDWVAAPTSFNFLGAYLVRLLVMIEDEGPIDIAIQKAPPPDALDAVLTLAVVETLKSRRYGYALHWADRIRRPNVAALALARIANALPR